MQRDGGSRFGAGSASDTGDARESSTWHGLRTSAGVTWAVNFFIVIGFVLLIRSHRHIVDTAESRGRLPYPSLPDRRIGRSRHPIEPNESSAQTFRAEQRECWS